MKAAVLASHGAPEFAEHPEPVTGDEALVRVHVEAATLNAVDIAIASGSHYLSPRSHPVVSGIEGAGTTADGRRVYFSLPSSPHGSMAEQTLVPAANLIEIPDELDFALAATLGNAGLAALMPLTSAAHMKPGENVVILGGTGVVGRLAVQIARLLGAGTITVVGRDAAALESTLELGATAVVATADLDEGALSARIREASGGADVIIDYTWGTVALAALRAGNHRVRLVQIGDRAGAEITIPAQLMRALGATVIGFMPVHYPEDMRASYRQLSEWAAAAAIRVDLERVPLADVAEAWSRAPRTRHKLVLVP